MLVDAALDPVCKFNNYAMLIRVHKVAIKQHLPDCMHDFPTAVREDVVHWAVSGKFLVPIIERVWQLSNCQSGEYIVY